MNSRNRFIRQLIKYKLLNKNLDMVIRLKHHHKKDNRILFSNK